jgi:hypothetical protein
MPLIEAAHTDVIPRGKTRIPNESLPEKTLGWQLGREEERRPTKHFSHSKISNEQYML